jgi:hypothetical protein
VNVLWLVNVCGFVVPYVLHSRCWSQNSENKANANKCVTYNLEVGIEQNDSL